MSGSHWQLPDSARTSSNFNYPITGLSSYPITGSSLTFSCWRLGGSVHSSRSDLSYSAWQDAVVAPVAKDVRIGIDSRFGDGGTPVLSVALGRGNGRCDPLVAQGKQRLVVRMTLRLDVEVHVVDAGRQRSQPLDLSVHVRVAFHRQPLIRCTGLGNQRVHAADDSADGATRPRVLEHPFAKLERQIANRHEIIVCLRGEPDHVIELQVLESVREDELSPVAD